MTRPRIACLYPSTGLLDGHLHALAATRGADLFVFRVAADPDAALPVASLAEHDRLAAVATTARSVRPDALAWACTAGSYLAGGEGERAQRRLLSEVAGCPATTTTAAVTWALAERGLRRPLVLSPYSPDVGGAFCRYLEARGLDVVAEAHAGHDTDEQISAMTVADILSLVPANGTWNGADCVVLPCTGLRSEPAAPAVRARTGLPVVTANAATLDHALHLVAAGIGQDSGVRIHATRSGRP